MQRGRVRRRGNRYERKITFCFGRGRNAHDLVVVLDRDFLVDGGVMTKDEALLMALEALEYEADKGNDNAYQRERDAIKQVLAAPVQPMAHIVGEIDHAGKVWKPAQRQWVGLTDEERGQAINANFGTGLWHMAKDIEAKLKEKNGGVV